MKLKKGGLASPKNVVIAALVGVVTLLLAGGVAVATHTAPDEFHGCVNDRSGVLRIVEDPAECRAGETAISWNQEGPIGPPGPAGPAGPAGADFAGDIYVDVSAVTGPQGSPGQDGVDGEDGAQGPPGQDGIDGEDGAQGTPGQDGLDGEDGAQGTPGISNLQRVTHTETSSDGSLILATVSCTGGRVVLGGGVQATNSSANVTINRPGVGFGDAGGSGGWTGYASAPGGFNLIVYAICADISP